MATWTPRDPVARASLAGEVTAAKLTDGAVAETWRTEGLRDALRWLRIFLFGLSGEGAVLSDAQQVRGPPADPQQEGSEGSASKKGALTFEPGAIVYGKPARAAERQGVRGTESPGESPRSSPDPG
jgi:hypothetical protein